MKIGVKLNLSYVFLLEYIYYENLVKRHIMIAIFTIRLQNCY